jgi:hypothetical protein
MRQRPSPATDNVIDVVRESLGNRQDPVSVSPLAWATTLAALTALASAGLALATMAWVAEAPDTPHSKALALLGGAIALVALLAYPERRTWLALSLSLATMLATVEAIGDTRQTFAPAGYAIGAIGAAIGGNEPWWIDYPKTRRYAVACLILFLMGSVYATRVALESDWELGVALGVSAMGAVVFAVVGAALRLAWRHGNPWPLLVVAILLTPLGILLSLSSIGVVFGPLLIGLWIATIRSFRRARTAARRQQRLG